MANSYQPLFQSYYRGQDVSESEKTILDEGQDLIFRLRLIGTTARTEGNLKSLKSEQKLGNWVVMGGSTEDSSPGIRARNVLYHWPGIFKGDSCHKPGRSDFVWPCESCRARESNNGGS